MSRRRAWAYIGVINITSASRCQRRRHAFDMSRLPRVRDLYSVALCLSSDVYRAFRTATKRRQQSIRACLSLSIAAISCALIIPKFMIIVMRKDGSQCGRNSEVTIRIGDTQKKQSESNALDVIKSIRC